MAFHRILDRCSLLAIFAKTGITTAKATVLSDMSISVTLSYNPIDTVTQLIEEKCAITHLNESQQE